MTRNDVETLYTTLRGVIRSPGKFEGEPVWAPYFWSIGLESGGDAETDVPAHEEGADSAASWGTLWFRVEEDDKAEFPEIAHRAWVCLLEDDFGNVSAWAPTAEEIAAMVAVNFPSEGK